MAQAMMMRAAIAAEPRSADRVAEARQELSVLRAQIEILNRLEQQINGWREWTEELDGHWSKVKTPIFDKITELVLVTERASRSQAKTANGNQNGI